MSDYITLTTLGEIYGVAAREVGRWLKNMGLRHEDGRPSRHAITQGFVQERPLDYGVMGYPRGGVAPIIEVCEGCVVIRGGS